MLLEQIRILNFRNYIHTVADIGTSKTIVLVGENGQGKTNFLEAIYCLSFGTSFRKHKEEALVRQGENRYLLVGVFNNNTIQHVLEVEYQNKRKKICYDGSLIQSRREIFELYPSIAFKHDDFFLLVGSAEQQRQYLDQTLSLCSPQYLDIFRNYQHTLQQKNAALRQEKRSTVPLFNLHLAKYGLALIVERKKYVLYIQKRLPRLFQHISGNSIEIELRYHSSWEDQDETTVVEQLNSKLDAEISAKFSLSGPHRDRLAAFLHGSPLKFMASTGQTRLLSLLLRSIQSEFYVETKQKSPVFLFDDVLLELDDEKRARFIQELPEARQSFFAFLPNEQIASLFDSRIRTFYIKNGVISETP